MLTDDKTDDYVIVHPDKLELFVNKEITHTIDLADWSTIGRHPFVSVPLSDSRLSNQTRLICKNRGITPHKDIVLSLFPAASGASQ
jgi:hypothetical protein